MKVLKGIACTLLSIVLIGLVGLLIIFPFAMMDSGESWKEALIGAAVIAGLAAGIGVLLWKLSRTAILVCGIILAFCVTIGLPIGLFGSESVGGTTLFVTIVGVVLIVLGVINKKKLRVVFSAIGLVLSYVAAYCAVNEIPWALRKIRGEDFLGQWMLLFVILMLVSLALTWLFWLNETHKRLDEAKDKLYFDGDLMILREFDRYRKIGYYLLKARLHGILQYEYQVEQGGVVRFNPDFTEEEKRAYCEVNPQVKRILKLKLKMSRKKSIPPETRSGCVWQTLCRKWKRSRKSKARAESLHTRWLKGQRLRFCLCSGVWSSAVISLDIPNF